MTGLIKKAVPQSKGQDNITTALLEKGVYADYWVYAKYTYKAYYVYKVHTKYTFTPYAANTA